MANNFDLRQFLTENKLTKNTKLLSEGSDYGYDDLMDVVDTEYDGDPTIARAVENAFHKGDIDTSEFGHNPSAPSKAVAQIVAAHDFGPAQYGDETQFEGADYDPDNEEFEDDEPFTGRYVSSRDIEEEVEEDGWKYFDIDGDEIEALYMDTVDGVKIYSATDSSVADTVSYVLEDPDGYVETIHIDVSGQPVSSEDIENEHEVVSYIADFIADDINSELGLDEGMPNFKNPTKFETQNDTPEMTKVREKLHAIQDRQDQYDADVKAGKLKDPDKRKEVRNKIVDDQQAIFAELNKLRKEADAKKQQTVKEAKSYKTSPNSKEVQQLKKGDILTSGDEVVSVSAGAKTPSGKVEVTVKTKSGKTKTNTWGKTTKIAVKEKETVKENTMTQRDKYLTRLVENALGLNVTEDDNVDYTMGNQDDPNQLPNPAPELTIPEGEEMVEEKPLPKYENIEKLMQEIDKNTDEEAHKFKMQEMKRVADMLEKKCTALEEGDDADHIDQKKLKQMKKDIMSLRKNIEKMEKLGEKKFAKKETKAELKEGFDLRKFLVENKLTYNSRNTAE